MSLTYDDFQQISAIVQAAIQPVADEVAALRNDVKELYAITVNLDRRLHAVEKRLSRLEATVFIR